MFRGCRQQLLAPRRAYSTAPGPDVTLKRSYLYVPSSSDKMLRKSLTVNSDVIVYDLEDSVAPSHKDKTSARTSLKHHLSHILTGHLSALEPKRIAVRTNDVRSPFFHEDIIGILPFHKINTLVLPKVNSAKDLDYASEHISQSGMKEPLNIVASIESAKSLWNLGEIASWKSSEKNGGVLSGLLFAAEDYCADTSIIRTKSRLELLYTRSQIVVAAKAFGLEAIDMVCTNYKSPDTLISECEEGRRMGFTGKQAIHPSQVSTIQSTFVPTSEEIIRAANILFHMAVAHSSQTGAIGLDGEMIDAPLIKQAEKIITVARAAGLAIPIVDC